MPDRKPTAREKILAQLVSTAIQCGFLGWLAWSPWYLWHSGFVGSGLGREVTLPEMVAVLGSTIGFIVTFFAGIVLVVATASWLSWAIHTPAAVEHDPFDED